MPLYDYHCKSCGLVKEHYVTSHTKETVNCACGEQAEKVKKTYAPTLQFMDGGFHSTDYPGK